jgi:GNAT superfamily N-acetyltransferase
VHGSGEPRILSGSAPEALRLAAAERLLGGRRADAEWFLRRLRDEGWRPEDLWCRRNSVGPLLASALISRHPGRTATVALSAPRDRPQASEGAALLREIVASLSREGGVALVQGMVAADETLAAAPFTEAGFLELAILACMERSNGRAAHVAAPGPGVELCPESASVDLGALLRETYEDTLDCPGLADLRRDDDILQGHRRGGNYDPQLWTVLRMNGRPAGAALLNRVPASGSVELTYLGLAKWARGKGLGKVLLDAALAKAATVPERIVSLAVDERNAPAERLYRSRGFRTVSRRRAFAIAVHSST